MTPRSRIQSGVSWEVIINDSSGKETGMCAFPYQWGLGRPLASVGS